MVPTVTWADDIEEAFGRLGAHKAHHTRDIAAETIRIRSEGGRSVPATATKMVNKELTRSRRSKQFAPASGIGMYKLVRRH